MPTKAEKRTSNRKLIMETAAKLFFEYGYMSTTMDLICETLGYTKPFVYHYFEDKAEILEALSFEAASITLSSLRTGAANKSTTRERIIGALKELLTNHVRLFVAGSLYLREAPYFSAQARTRMRKLARDFRGDLIALLDSGVGEGVLPKQDTSLTASAIGGIVGFMYTWYRPNGVLPPEQIVDRLLEIILRTAGLKVESSCAVPLKASSRIVRKGAQHAAARQIAYPSRPPRR
jgi:AcrR family transcriptional regulator